MTELQEAVSFHASNAIASLRKQRRYANVVYLSLKNSPFDKAVYFGASLAVPFPASSHSP
ncbi:hypothetical protein [Methylophilus sp. OH31]|uniref:DinB/UmuC family translesion DNA polymerase n=1 Tax=Methylophilus sp. OH31 TaxID=1387312 RepID=UPI00351C38ED